MSKITNAKFVSRVLNAVNSLNKDTRRSRRFILHTGLDKARTYISQKLKDKTLFREDNIYSPVSCFELEQIEAIKCPAIEFRMCEILMRSKKRVPDLVYSQYGPAILLITNVKNDKAIKLKTLQDYITGKNRLVKNVGVYAYLYDGYLYIPDHTIQSVNLSILTLNKKEANDVSNCSECDTCKSIWDYQFVCPDKLLEPVIEATINEIAGITVRIPKDENPNMDSNEKSKTVV